MEKESEECMSQSLTVGCEKSVEHVKEALALTHSALAVLTRHRHTLYSHANVSMFTNYFEPCKCKEENNG